MEVALVRVVMGERDSGGGTALDGAELVVVLGHLDVLFDPYVALFVAVADDGAGLAGPEAGRVEELLVGPSLVLLEATKAELAHRCN